MTIWDLRQIIESHISVYWLLFYLAIGMTALIYKIFRDSQ